MTFTARTMNRRTPGTRDLALQEAAGAEAVEQTDLLGITAHL